MGFRASQPAPKPFSASPGAISSGDFFDMFSATFEPEPMETNIPFAVPGKSDVACAVSAVRFGQLRNDDFRLAGGLQIAVVIGKADHGIVVGDIDPLRIIARRIE